jgi:hypothetical protein
MWQREKEGGVSPSGASGTRHHLLPVEFFFLRKKRPKLNRRAKLKPDRTTAASVGTISQFMAKVKSFREIGASGVFACASEIVES